MATVGVGIAWGVYKVKKDKDKAAKFRKATMGCGISAAVLLFIVSLLDVLVVAEDSLPRWFPDMSGGDDEGNG